MNLEGIGGSQHTDIPDEIAGPGLEAPIAQEALVDFPAQQLPEQLRQASLNELASELNLPEEAGMTFQSEADQPLSPMDILKKVGVRIPLAIGSYMASHGILTALFPHLAIPTAAASLASMAVGPITERLAQFVERKIKTPALELGQRLQDGPANAFDDMKSTVAHMFPNQEMLGQSA